MDLPHSASPRSAGLCSRHRLPSSLFIHLCVLAVLGPVPLFAQGFGRVANEPFSGVFTITNARSRPLTGEKVIANSNITLGRGSVGGSSVQSPPRSVSRNVLPLILDKWESAAPRMVDSALIFLDERNLGGGFRTSKNKLVIQRPAAAYIGWDGRGFLVRLDVPGNRLSTWLRTPTALGEDFDPGFAIDFDLEISMDIDLVGNELVARPFRIKPTVRRPSGRNIPGSAVVAINNLLAELTGADFVGVFLKYANSSSIGQPSGLDGELKLLNAALAAAAAGGTIMPGYTSGAATLTIRDAGQAPVVR